MNKAIISKQKQERLNKYSEIKSEFKRHIKDGGQRTAIIKYMASEQKISIATIYKAIK